MEDVLSRISRIKSRWFLTEPVYFSVMLTHEFVAIENLGCPVCVGNGKIMFDTEYYNDKSDKFLEESIKAEELRIMLSHPYRRLLPDRKAMLQASNIIVGENTNFEEAKFNDAREALGISTHSKERLEYYYEILAKAHENGNWRIGKSDDGCSSKSDADARTKYWGEDAYMNTVIEQVLDKFMSSDNWGSIGGDFKDTIKSAKIPDYNYKGILQQFRSHVISSKRTLTRMKPNRRFGYDVMGSRREFTSKILVAIDTSASISDDDVSKALGLINGMFKYGIECIDCVDFDVNVYDEDLTSIKKKMKSMRITGRGGTDFNDVFRYVSEHRGYTGCIIITDGYAPVPDRIWLSKTRRAKFVWCLNSRKNFTIFTSNNGFSEFGKATYII